MFSINCIYQGFKLYTKYKENARIKFESSSINYKNYKPIITASAPGKIILSGEHSLNYGVTAVSSAINKRTYITIYEPIDIHRVIDLKSNNKSSPVNSRLIVKLNDVELIWKISDLISIHNLTINKWFVLIIK